MFQFDAATCNVKSDTLELLLERDGFKVEKTPTLDKHMEFLRNLTIVKGLTLNSNLYSKNEKEAVEDIEED